MSSKQEIEAQLQQQLEQYKEKVAELENKFIEEKSQTDPVNQKICTEKIEGMKTTLQSLEKELDVLQRADQQDHIDRVKEGIDSLMGNMDEEFRSSLAYFH
jgi:chromosome segregation ATPase